VRIVETVFLVIGLALLCGSGALYYYQVHLPQSWPRVSAEVVSSRVVNPANPNQHSPELVVRFESGGATRQVTIQPGWSSASYDMVKSHVDGHPAGSNLEVAINPADAGDVRYELGPTLSNLLGPLIVGGMGLIFAAVGVFTLTRSRAASKATPEENRTLTRRVAVLFCAIGAGIIGLGIWLGAGDLEMTRTWPPVEAEVVSSRSVATRSSVNNRPSVLVYDVQVLFRYTVDGRTYESQTMTGASTSSTFRRDELLEEFAPGTRHRINHRPDDPNVIRYNLDSPLSTFGLSGGMALMGLVFLGFGLLFLRVTRDAHPARRGSPQGRSAAGGQTRA
jgi:hypothetical protein